MKGLKILGNISEQFNKALEANNIRGYALELEFQNIGTEFSSDMKFARGELNTNAIAIQLMMGGLPIIINEDTNVYANVGRADGTTLTNECETLEGENGIVLLKFKSQSINIQGSNRFEIVLKHSDEEKLISPKIKFDVYETFDSALNFPAEDEISVLDGLINNVNNLQVEVSKFLSDNSIQINNKFAELNTVIEGAQLTVNSSVEELRETINGWFDARITEITEKVITFDEFLESSNAILELITTQNTTAKKNVDDLNSKSTAAEGKIAELNSANNTAIEKIKELQGIIATAIEKINSLSSKNTEASEKITTLEAKITQAGKDIVTLEAENTKALENVANLKNNNTEAVANVTELKTQNQTAKNNLSALDTKNSTANNNISELNTQNEKATASVSSLSSENLRAESLKTSLKEKNSEANATINSLINENRNANTKITSLNSENDKATTNISNLSKQNASATANINSLDTKNTDATGLINSLTSKNSTAETIVNNLDSKIAAGNGVVANLDSKNQTATSNISTLTSKISEGNTTKTKLQEEIVKAEDIIESIGGLEGLVKDVNETLTGTNIRAERTYNSNVNDIVIEGKTYQNIVGEQTQKTEGATYDAKTTKGTLVANEGIHFSNKLLKANTKYTIFINIIKNVGITEGTSGVKISVFGDIVLEKEFVNIPQNAIGMQRFVIQGEAINRGSILIYMRTNITEVFEFDSFMMLEGDHTNTPLSELPYIEGIKSVGEEEGNEIQVLSSGKNLFNLNKLTPDYTIKQTIEGNTIKLTKGIGQGKFSYCSIKLKPNTKYTLTYKNIKSCVLYIYKDYLWGKILVSSPSEYITFTTVDQTDYIFGIYIASDISEVICSDIMITEGLVDVSKNSYEPYQEDITQISLSEPLRSLPNGVADTIEKVDGKYCVVRRIGGVILNGSENWVKNTNWGITDVNTSAFIFDRVNHNGIDISRNQYDLAFLCDKLPTRNPYATDQEGCVSHLNNIRVRILKSKLTTDDAQGIKEYLASNNIELIYELATPVVEELDQEIQYELEHIKTFQEVTHISTTNNIQPKLTVNVDRSIGGVVKDTVERMDIVEAKVKEIDRINIKKVEGINITEVDSVLGKTNGMVIDGRTYQNLIQKADKISAEFRVIAESSLLKPDTVYTLIVENTSSNSYGVYFGENVFVSIPAFRVPKGVYMYVVRTRPDILDSYVLKNHRDNTEYTLKNIMLLEGDHTNNPNLPTYIEGIQGVGNKVEDGYKVEITSTNKNLFNIDAFASDFKYTDSKGYCIRYENGFKVVKTDTNAVEAPILLNGFYRLPIKPNTDYTVSYKRGTSASHDLFIWLNRTGYITTPCYGNDRTLTFNSGDNDNLSIRVDANNDGDCIYQDIQIEEGKVATSYAQYESSVASVILKDQLYSLPNGIKDELLEDGSVIRRVGKLVLSDNETGWLQTDTQTKNTLTVYKDFDNIYNTKPVSVMSNNFTILTDYAFDDRKGIYSLFPSNNKFRLAIRFNKTDLATADITGAIKWLNENPTVVYYEVENPKTIPCDSVTLPNKAVDVIKGDMIEKRVGKITIDGNVESSEPNTTFSTFYNLFQVALPNSKNYPHGATSGILSTREFASIADRTVEGHTYKMCTIQGGDGLQKVQFLMPKEITTLIQFKQWLSENPTEIWYELRNPHTERYVSKYNLNVDTHNSITHITCNSIVKPNIRFEIAKNLLATTVELSKRVSKLENQIALLLQGNMILARMLMGGVEMLPSEGIDPDQGFINNYMKQLEELIN